jgi:hypothetical protein
MVTNAGFAAPVFGAVVADRYAATPAEPSIIGRLVNLLSPNARILASECMQCCRIMHASSMANILVGGQRNATHEADFKNVGS